MFQGGEYGRGVVGLFVGGGTKDYHIMNHYFVGQFVIAHSLFAGRWHNAFPPLLLLVL